MGRARLHHGLCETKNFQFVLRFLNMSNILKKLPSKERLLQVKKLSAEIFGENWNPDNVRTGAKILKAPLKGPELVNYYGKNDSMPTFNDFKEWFPELQLVDPREETRLKMVQDRKKRNNSFLTNPFVLEILRKLNALTTSFS